ncbi:MAG: response regulator transcription factor [Lachnospiraceae bacterium]
MACIYVVEDDKNIREIEIYALQNSGYEVVGFANAKEFYKKINEKVPNLVLLDIMLPDEDGLDIVMRLRTMAATKRVPIIMVTARTTEIDKVKGLNMGADDYLGKPFGVMELIARVKAMLRRSMDEDGEHILEHNQLRMDEEKREVYVNNELCELTYKEYELCKLLLKNAGNVMTRDIIMERIWGIDFQGESRTLDMHIKTLRQKLGEAGSMIKTVRNVGYRME